jgi:putative tricarboxylic transport membrane protein
LRPPTVREGGDRPARRPEEGKIDHAWRGEYTHKASYLDSGNPADKQLSLAEWLRCTPAVLRSSLVGIVIGVLPGLGASLSSFLAYSLSKRYSKTPETFGKGAMEGVASSEAADNASVPASLVPMFAIGLPGSLSTALLMGAFMLQGLTPGPFLFRDDAVLVYGIFIGMMLASVILLMVGLLGQRFFARVILLPDTIILPVIVFLCVAGAYLEGGSMFSVYLMLIFAFVGYFMKKFDYSFVTFLIGFILGPMAELSLRQAIIISNADPRSLIDHPVALIFLVLAVVSVWRFSSLHLLETTMQQAASDPGAATDQQPRPRGRE